MKKSPYFTLFELLIVVAIISILISILLPSLNRAREKAIRAVCASNQNQIYKGAILWAQNNNGWIPYGHSWSIHQLTYNTKHNGMTLSVGHMIDDEILSDPLVYYCPNNIKHYNAPNNSWTGDTRRITYNITPNYQAWNQLQFKIIVGGNKKLIAEMDGEAVSMDRTYNIDYKLHHGDGMVVQFADGVNKFIKISAVKSKWNLLNGISTAYNTKMHNFWKEIKLVR
ncbi:MAG: hypothetical protein NE328_20670 [Lentisphaeraceae bacterium]|nr:hypothetical protein [Lentisphaeraceae bacterium]